MINSTSNSIQELVLSINPDLVSFNIHDDPYESIEYLSPDKSAYRREADLRVTIFRKEFDNYYVHIDSSSDGFDINIFSGVNPNVSIYALPDIPTVFKIIREVQNIQKKFFNSPEELRVAISDLTMRGLDSLTGGKPALSKKERKLILCD